MSPIQYTCFCTFFPKFLFYFNPLYTDDDDTDFRNGRFGMWDNDIYDTPGLDWILGKGETPTERTGPRGDHTTKKGIET
jgi:hypothetical protein